MRTEQHYLEEKMLELNEPKPTNTMLLTAAISSVLAIGGLGMSSPIRRFSRFVKAKRKFINKDQCQICHMNLPYCKCGGTK